MNESNEKYVVLEGTPFNRGLVHGKTLKQEIIKIINVWKTSLQKQIGSDPDAYINKFLDNTNYLPAIEKYTPDLLEEVKGIAEGSGIAFNTLYAFQLLDEFIYNGEDIHGEHCSTIGLNKLGDQPAYLAQNWDIGAHMHGFQTTLHIKNEDSGIESFIFSYAGFIAAFGMNNKRVGVCVNSIGQLNYAREGLPVAFVVRGALEQPDQQEAINFLHEIKHASPQNYLIGGPKRIHDFECSTNQITPFVNREGSEVVYHTNHALANDDYNAKHLDFIKNHDEQEIKKDNSHTRFDALEKRLNVSPEHITFDTIKAALSSHDSDEHPVCMNYKENAPLYNLGSTIMVLSGAPEFHIAFGPPDVTPHIIYKFA
ncbi:MAG: hypothetical protein JRH15_05255 [Deltaproteobacteria bacterium]|nr:hypothetical protein [Deltaproteobacteria bacterium]